MKQYRTFVTLFLLVFAAGSVTYAATYYYGQVNINTATIYELMQVPSMTRDLAKNIIHFRDSNGPFSSTNDLLKVKGFNQYTLDKMKDHLKPSGETDILRWDI